MTIQSGVNIQLENNNHNHIHIHIHKRRNANSASQRSEGETSDSNVEIEDINAINEYQTLQNQANQRTETVNPFISSMKVPPSPPHLNFHSVNWVTKLLYLYFLIKYAFFRK